MVEGLVKLSYDAGIPLSPHFPQEVAQLLKHCLGAQFSYVLSYDMLNIRNRSI